MVVWSMGIEACKGQQGCLWGSFPWTQQRYGLPERAPARLSSRKQALADNEAASCTTGEIDSDRPRGCDTTFQHEEFQEMGLRELNWSLPDDPYPRRPTGGHTGLTAETVSQLCHRGHVTEAVEALGVLVQTDCCIPNALFYNVLKSCVGKKDFVLGRRVHALTVRQGYQSDTFLCNHILRMYASHGRLQDAMDVFTVVGKPDAFMWSSIISAHVQQGQDKEAIELYHRMRRSSVKPDGHVFVAALQACARAPDLIAGQQVHADVSASGVEPDLFVCSCLVDMYAKCGSLEEAQRVFEGLGQKDVVTWNAMIAGYSQQGRGQEALCLYSDMRDEGITVPNAVTFVCLLQACASVGTLALERGKQIHAQIRDRGYQADVFVANSLVNMYAKCGSLEDAQIVFEGLRQKDVVSWTALIAGFSQQGRAQEALRLYSAMQEEGMAVPNSVTFVCLLQACASLGTSVLEKGRQIHTQIRERGEQVDVFLANSLVNMYAKCGSLEDAQRVFDGLALKDVVTWTALIGGYSQQGRGQEALGLYSAMQEEGIAIPDSVTSVCLLQACASVGTPALEKGKLLHANIRKRGYQYDVFVASSIVNMYAKCGSLENAQRVFDQLGHKDVVTWTALIAGYSQHGMGQEALRLYSAMQDEGIAVPNSTTFVCLLQACANVAALHLGRQLHAQIEAQELQADVSVAVSLISMYGRCGSMADAQQVFDALLTRDISSWNALIAGYSHQGSSDQVFDLVLKMRDDGTHPDAITFLAILSVCSHTGLVSKGQQYFEAMKQHHSITPAVEHYTCMVDLLGRAGQLDEALTLATTMPVPPDGTVWRTLLGACRKWSNVEVGRQAFNQAVRLDNKDAASYVLMSSLYSTAQLWEQGQEMQARRIKIRAWKQPGQSWWTDMDGLVHTFLAGDKKHPRVKHGWNISFPA